MRKDKIQTLQELKQFEGGFVWVEFDQSQPISCSGAEDSPLEKCDESECYENGVFFLKNGMLTSRQQQIHPLNNRIVSIYEWTEE